MLALMLTLAGTLHAQERTPDYLIYMQDGRVFAQALYGSDRIDLGEPLNNVEIAFRNSAPTLHEIYDNRPLIAPEIEVDDPFGFTHGVLTPDGTAMIALEQENAAFGYRIVRYMDANSEILHTGTMSTDNGYLDPLGFAPDGSLLLLERTMRYRLEMVNIWRLSLDNPQPPALVSTFDVGVLSGRTAILPDGSGVLLGVALSTHTGYTFNFEQMRVFAFPFQTTPPPEPRSVFELYPFPVHVIGVLPIDDINTLRGALNTVMPNPGAPTRPQPFLHWSLSDDHRRITCYPDSNWTNATFDYTCAGMASPRAYDGHQGTDVGGILDGLPIGTPVYPATRGVVVRQFEGCSGGIDVSCGSAYGNIVMLEHTLTVNGESQLWFTGYAHLHSTLVEVGMMIDNLTEPIAYSGETGVGGPHLHFEVRNWYINANNRWVDPWGAYYAPHDESLWIGGNDRPTALVTTSDENE